PATGLPPANTRYAVVPYHSGLQLEYLGTPGVGVGVNTLGRAGFAGGVAAYFGDLLGNNTLGTTLQVNGTVKDFGGELFYLNTAHRWNWLTGVSHIPYLTGGAFVGDTNVTLTDGQTVPAQTFTQVLERIYVDQAQATAQYPFSQTKRVEIGASYTYLHYGFESNELILLSDGESLQRTGNLKAPPGVSYG